MQTIIDDGSVDTMIEIKASTTRRFCLRLIPTRTVVLFPNNESRSLRIDTLRGSHCGDSDVVRALKAAFRKFVEAPEFTTEVTKIVKDAAWNVGCVLVVPRNATDRDLDHLVQRFSVLRVTFTDACAITITGSLQIVDTKRAAKASCLSKVIMRAMRNRSNIADWGANDYDGFRFHPLFGENESDCSLTLL